MNLPIRALYEIRAFSRPASRPDWRTCKSVEARMIREYEISKFDLNIPQLLDLILGLPPLQLELVAGYVENMWELPMLEAELL